jgi:Domain of unknown function (DUF3448).
MAKRSKKKKRKSKSKKKKSFKRKKKKILRKKKKSLKKKSKKISSKKKNSKQIEDSDGNIVFKVPPNWEKQAYVNQSQYTKKYKLSIKDNEGFWAKEGKRISWIKPYTKIKDVKYSKEDVSIKWYYDGTLNASANCI